MINFGTISPHIIARIAAQQWTTAIMQERLAALSKLAALLGKGNFIESFAKWHNNDGQVYSLQDAYMICWRRLMRDDLLPWEVEYSMAAE